MNWKDMKNIKHHAFYNELSVDTEDHPVLQTVHSKNPKASREKMKQTMYKNVLRISDVLGDPGMLSLYPSGRKTGIVMDSGEDATHTVPI